jgi:hypothetical protein
MAVVIDDRLLLDVMIGAAPSAVTDELADGSVFTTSCWYWRLGRAITAGTGTGSLSSRLTALATEDRDRVLWSLQELPEEIALLTSRTVVPVTQVPRRGTCKGVRAGSGGRRRRVGQGGGRCRRMVRRSGDGHGCRRAREGARGWGWWWRVVMWAISRVGSVSGDRSGWAAASWSKTRPGRAQLARLQRRHLGTHAQFRQRYP